MFFLQAEKCVTEEGDFRETNYPAFYLTSAFIGPLVKHAWNLVAAAGSI